MNRSLALAVTSVAVAATAILGVHPASADADLDIRADGQSIYSGGVAVAGSRITFDATGCLDQDQPGYVGMFVSGTGDPLTNEADHGEAPASLDGTFHADFGVTPMDPGNGTELTSYLRWYCSSSPIESLSDPTLYSSELITMTIGTPPAGAPAGRAKVSVTVGSAKASPSASAPATYGTRVTTDPNALPLADHLGIEGNRAAILKQKVDSAAGVSRNKPVGNSDYVKAAYKVLAKKAPTTKQLAQGVASLDRGSSRVRVVEGVALTVNPSAKLWNGLPLILLYLL